MVGKGGLSDGRSHDRLKEWNTLSLYKSNSLVLGNLRTSTANQQSESLQIYYAKADVSF